MSCNLCGKIVERGDGADVNPKLHAACSAEYARRTDDDKCARCGDDAVDGGVWCGYCDSSSPYIGYPPGGA